MGSQFLKTVFDALLAMASCDGHLHEDEVEVLELFKSEFSNELKSEDGLDCVLLKADVSETNINTLISCCSEDRAKYFAMHWLSRMTDADRYIHESERKFLSLLRDGFGISPVTTKRISWEKEQLKVIQERENSRIVVEAPPGAGKTAVIAAKINSLIESGIVPSNIWLISFTRVAVREMKDRVTGWSSSFPAGLKVATLDQTAFRMNIALGVDVEELIGDYTVSIEQFMKKIETRDPDFMDFIDGMEHLIIDEAQDFVGAREELCLQLIDSLPNECGVSVLGDTHQAIYGWNSSDTGNLQLTLQDNELGRNFKSVELQKIHRTSSPALLGLIEDLRLDLAVYDSATEENWDRRIDMIDDALSSVTMDETADIASDNSLILFRKTTEVLDALIYFSLKGRRARIRLPKYPRYFLSWIADLLKFSTESELEILTKNDYELFASLLLQRDSLRFDSETAWSYLLEKGGDGEEVSLVKLREKLGSASTRAVEFIVRDFGMIGPVLGNVHSSKGTESDHVYFLPSRIKKGNLAEESRVLFVGTSRAKKDAFVIDSEVGEFEEDWKRVSYRYSKKQNTIKSQKFPRIFMELGFDGDYDPYSIVSKYVGSIKSSQAQRFLERYWPSSSAGECFAKYCYDSCEYSIYYQFSSDPEGDNLVHLGKFSPQLETALLAACYAHFKFRGHLPARLSLQIVDVATFVADKHDERLSNSVAFAAKQGAWLYPVIFSLGPFIYPGR